MTKSVKEKLNKLSNQVFQKAKLLQFKIDDLELPQLNKFCTELGRKGIADNLDLKEDDVLFITYGPKSDAVKLFSNKFFLT